MGGKTHLSVNLPQSVSISGAGINLTLRAVTTYVPCCNLAPSMSALKMCIFLKHCHEMTRFLLWIGTYCISCVVQQTSGVKDLSSLVRYGDICLAAIRHVQSSTRGTSTPKYTLPQRLVIICTYHRYNGNMFFVIARLPLVV